MALSRDLSFVRLHGLAEFYVGCSHSNQQDKFVVEISENELDLWRSRGCHGVTQFEDGWRFVSIRLKLPSASRLKNSFASVKLRKLKILNDEEVLSMFDKNTDAVNKK